MARPRIAPVTCFYTATAQHSSSVLCLHRQLELAIAPDLCLATSWLHDVIFMHCNTVKVTGVLKYVPLMFVLSKVTIRTDLRNQRHLAVIRWHLRFTMLYENDWHHDMIAHASLHLPMVSLAGTPIIAFAQYPDL
jgi:hypothetical protein